jgi:glutamine phosphoribosylpyrophosphate amidotransferase
MCGLAGVLISDTQKGERELQSVAALFTRMLIGSQHRGPHATGAAIVASDGSHSIAKAPLSAHRFVEGPEYQGVLARINKKTRLLMGHTRWPTRGSHLDNRNNHPLAGRGRRPCIITHNGHIANHESLSHRMGLRREAEVDSEVVLRLAERNASRSGIDQAGLAQDLALCRGRISAVVVATTDPTKILLVKGNQPLEVRRHPERGLVIYASEPEILDDATDLEDGWENLCIPPWRIAAIDTRQIQTTVTYPIPVSPEDWRPLPWH